jgi:hypothetical protein
LFSHELILPGESVRNSSGQEKIVNDDDHNFLVRVKRGGRKMLDRSEDGEIACRALVLADRRCGKTEDDCARSAVVDMADSFVFAVEELATQRSQRKAAEGTAGRTPRLGF